MSAARETNKHWSKHYPCQAVAVEVVTRTAWQMVLNALLQHCSAKRSHLYRRGSDSEAVSDTRMIKEEFGVFTWSRRRMPPKKIVSVSRCYCDGMVAVTHKRTSLPRMSRLALCQRQLQGPLHYGRAIRSNGQAIMFCSCDLLWSPYLIGQTIIFSSCGFFFLSFSFFFFPRLFSAVAGGMSTILPHMVWRP